MRSAQAALFLLFLLGSGIAQIDPNIGIPRFSTQLGGTYDSINPATSNILISLPIRDKTGKIPVSLRLVSNFHVYDTNGSPDFWATPDGRDMFNLVTVAGDLGAAVGFSSHTTSSPCRPGMSFWQFDNFVIFDETGASHEITPATTLYADPFCGRQKQATVQTVDGSGYTLKLAVNVDPNGVATINHQLIDKSGNVQTQSANSHTVTDSDGVQAQYSWARQGPSADVSVITDTLGQTMITETATPFVQGVSPGGIPTTYQYTDANGQIQTLTVNYSQYSVQTNFGCTWIREANGTDFLPSSIVMADGETFYLSYEPTPGYPSSVTRRIAKLTLPLGGSISYGYSGGNNGIYCARQGGSPHMVPTLTRTVDDGNGHIGTWTYVNSNSTGSNENYTVTETDPQDNVTVYTFTPAFGNQTAGVYETQRQIYQGAASPQNLLKTIITCYNGNFSNCASPELPPFLPVLNITGVTQTDVYTYFNGSPNGSLVETRFNMVVDPQGIPIDLSGTIAEVKEYDVGATMPPTGAPIKDTITSYGSWNGSSCSPITNIVDHPCVVTVRDSSGNTAAQTRYTYNAGGHLTQMSRLVNGSTYITSSATYAANGALTTSTDANGTVTQYTNGACNGLLPTQITVANITTAKTWDCNGGVVTSTTDANNQVTHYGYQDPHTTGHADPLWRLTSITYPDGGQTTTTYNPLSTPANITTDELVDSSGLTLTTQTNFDGLGRVVQKSITSDPEGADIVDTTYDTLGRTASVSNPHRSAAAATDGITTSSYDALGRIVTVKHPDGSVVQTAYANNSVTVTDETGRRRRSYSDGLGRIIRVDEPGPGADSAGVPSSGTVTINGSLLSKQVQTQWLSSGGATFSISGGVNQRLFDPCRTNGAPSCPLTIYNAGEVSLTINGFKASAGYGGNPGQHSTPQAIAADLVGQLGGSSSPVTVTASGGTFTVVAKAQGALTNYSYTESATWNNSICPDGAPCFSFPSFYLSPYPGNVSGALSGGMDPANTTVYDSGTTTITINGQPISYSWSGPGTTAASIAQNLTSSVTNYSSYATASASGATVNLSQKVAGVNYSLSSSSTGDSANFGAPSFTTTISGSFLGGGTGPGGLYMPYVTLYSYDALGDLLSVNQQGDGSAAARNRNFTYDSLSRLKTATNPEAGKIQYGYDANGNVTTKTDNKGTVITYSYDALNRLTRKSFSDGKAPYLFSYDQSTFRGVSLSNTIGRLSSSSNNVNAGGALSYDAMGRVKYQTNCLPSDCSDNPNGVTAVYNLAGELTSLTYPSGRHLTNTYNAAARLTGVSFTDFNGAAVNYPYVSAVHYAPTGIVKKMVYGNGVVDAVDYNNRLQPLNALVSADTQTFSHKAYLWSLNGGNNGSVGGITDLLNGSRNQSFGYDALNRLTSAQADSFNQTYSYDAFGNLTQHGSPIDTSGFSFNASNQMIGGGIVYDTNGNMIKANTGQTLAYNAENQIISVNDGAVSNYTYDAEGQRVRKDLPAGAFTEYVYFGGNVIAEKDQASSWSDYIYAGEKRIARALDYDDRIFLQGTNCSECGAQYTFFHLNGPSVLGYTIQPGDQLYAAQQQTNSRGGFVIRLKDASNTISYCQTNDEASQNIQDDSTQQTWHYRRMDLSLCAGKQILDFAVVVNSHTPAGTWQTYYESVALVSADGAVYPIYDHDKSVSMTVEATSGVSQIITTTVQHNPGVGQAPKNTTFYHEDTLGSSRLMTSYGGWPVWQGTFSPFGQEINPQPTANHYKFTGKERDAESGLDYFGARHYSSAMGRFMSTDPYNAIMIKQGMELGGLPAAAAESFFDDFLENPQNWNKYTYALNNPLRFTDPTGEAPADGHHLIVERNALGPAGSLARDFADKIKTGPLSGNGFPNQPGFNAAHRAYNEAVKKMLDVAVETKGPIAGWDVNKWKDFATNVLNSEEPAIKNFLDELEQNNPGARAALASSITAYRISVGFIARAVAATIIADTAEFLSDMLVCIDCSVQREMVGHKIIY